MSTKKDKESLKRQRQWEEENRKITWFRDQTTQFKLFVQSKGCVLPFYDLLDSYVEEFQLTVANAKTNHPSLVNIHEVDDRVYHNPNWTDLGYGGYKRIFFNTEEKHVADYTKHEPAANICGRMTAFLDAEHQLRTVILIRRTVREHVHKELQYGFKLPALVHEIGHVHDIENGINFNVQSAELELIEAEVFANLFALEKLASRQLVGCYNLLANAMRDAQNADGYIGEVARRVIQRLPLHKLVNWTNYLDPASVTDASLSALSLSASKSR